MGRCKVSFRYLVPLDLYPRFLTREPTKKGSHEAMVPGQCGSQETWE